MTSALSRCSVAVLAAAALALGCGPRGPRGPADAPRAPSSASPVAQPAGADPFAADRMMADVAWLTDPARAGRGAYQPGGRATAAWIAGVFSDLGLRVVRQPVGGGAENVIGILEGGPEAVVVGAHYDHLGSRGGLVYPGADDNASGVAVLLALARAHVAAGPSARTIVFAAFGAEEEGLIGSARYIAEPAWPLERTVAMINFDMVGRRFFELGANRPAAVGVIGLEGDEAAAAALQKVAGRVGLELVAAPARLLEVFGYAYRTDDWWFRRQGIRAFHFSTGFHIDYHQPSDTPDKLVPAQLRRIARAADGLLDHLAGDPGHGGK